MKKYASCSLTEYSHKLDTLVGMSEDMKDDMLHIIAIEMRIQDGTATEAEYTFFDGFMAFLSALKKKAS